MEWNTPKHRRSNNIFQFKGIFLQVWQILQVWWWLTLRVREWPLSLPKKHWRVVVWMQVMIIVISSWWFIHHVKNGYCAILITVRRYNHTPLFNSSFFYNSRLLKLTAVKTSMPRWSRRKIYETVCDYICDYIRLRQLRLNKISDSTQSTIKISQSWMLKPTWLIIFMLWQGW